MQKALIPLLVAKEITISTKYLYFANIFLKKSATEFFGHFDINKHLINLESSK